MFFYALHIDYDIKQIDSQIFLNIFTMTKALLSLFISHAKPLLLFPYAYYMFLSIHFFLRCSW